MKCSFCGLEFSMDKGTAACSGCSMSFSRCNMIRCPNCGYETLPEPGLVKFLRRRFSNENE